MISKKLLGLIFIFFIVILLLNYPKTAFGQERLCEWKSPIGMIPEKNLIDYGDQKITLDPSLSGLQNLQIQCIFQESIDLSNKLLRIQFLTNPSNGSDLQFSLVDFDGNKISTQPIIQLYGISENKVANISLDPKDFTIKDSIGFDLKKTIFLQANLNLEDIEQFEIYHPFLHYVEDYPSFTIFENLPVQSTIPGFVSLLFISFPLGYVILDYSGFLRKQNFILKIPWFLASGFIFYMLYTYITSHLWISFETILIFVIGSYAVFIVYLIKNKNFNIKSQNLQPKSSSLIFVIFLIISGIISVSLAESAGWPTDNEDSRQHTAFTVITMRNNVISDGRSYAPINDLVFGYQWYPKGSHTAAAGLSFFSELFPPTSLISILSFILFLIPPLLASFVYKFTNSVFLSTIMFMLSFWRPGNSYWYGDIIWNKWAAGIYAGEVGVFLVLLLLMFFVVYFEKKDNKKTLLALIIFSFGALFVTYYAVAAIIVIIGVILLVTNYIKNKKKSALVLSSLAGLFITIPYWSKEILKGTILEGMVVTSHHKYIAHFPFDPNDFLFPFWISSAFALAVSIFLLREKKYRTLSLSFIIISLIQILTISKDIMDEYFFYIQNTRSLGLMFFLSIVINLILIHIIINRTNLKKKISELGRSKFVIKGVVISIFILLLLPSAEIWYDLANRPWWHVGNAPGGNESEIMYWIYKNTNPSDLILNDHSAAAQWLFGFRGQTVLNSWWGSMTVSREFNEETKQFEPAIPPTMDIVKANQILKNPWDYEYITHTLTEVDIKYLYVSERSDLLPKCMKSRPDSCYPDSWDWPWHNFSGNSRIDMYENHPKLELIIRNGDSALFRVI